LQGGPAWSPDGASVVYVNGEVWGAGGLTRPFTLTLR
jgi:hypothetical protein